MVYTGTYRLMVHQPGRGAENMAIDEVLLLQVGLKKSPPILRLYGFSPPTLSLGRFQRHGILSREHLQRDGIDLVRRPTGGQAVLHDQELTYAVILGREHLQPFSKREIYRFIAGLLLKGLTAIGVRGVSNHSRSGDLHNPNCFAATGEYEIATLQNKKLVGSAQILNRDASLQHGAIPLSAAYMKISDYIEIESERPEIDSASLRGELGEEVDFARAQDAFVRTFQQELNTERSDLTDEEQQQVRYLMNSKYRAEQWTLRH